MRCQLSIFEFFFSCYTFMLYIAVTQYLPPNLIKIKDMNISSTVTLANSAFYKPREVDVVIDGETFRTLLDNVQIKLSAN